MIRLVLEDDVPGFGQLQALAFIASQQKAGGWEGLRNTYKAWMIPGM